MELMLRKATKMKTNCYYMFIFLLIGSLSIAAERVTVKSNIVNEVYPSLTTGVLTYAKILDLKNGTILKYKNIEINEKDLKDYITSQPGLVRAELEENLLFVLEQYAGKQILADIALEENAKNNIQSKNDNNSISAYLENMLADTSVNDQEVEKFYEENVSVFNGTPLSAVKEQIKSYVLQEKKLSLVAEYIKNIGLKYDISIAGNWLKEQALISQNNLLDMARSSEKATIAIFSAASCCGPDKMAPIRDALTNKYKDQLNIVYINAKEQQVLSARYGVKSIPTQIIFDDMGKEVFRHSGFYTEEDIINKIDVLEIK